MLNIFSKVAFCINPKNFMQVKKVLNRKMAWNKYSRLASAHGFEIIRNSIRTDSQFVYLTESPGTIQQSDGIDLGSKFFNDKIVISYFDKPPECNCLKWVNKNLWHTLMDHHLSMPENLNKNFHLRINKAILIRSEKQILKGHKLRHKLKENEFLDIVDTKKKSIEDLRPIFEKYKFAVVIENDIWPGVNSEQIYGAFKSGCVPLYLGDLARLQKLGFEGIYNLNEFVSKEFDELIGLPNDDGHSISPNFEKLLELRLESLTDFMSFPAMYLIRGER